MKSLRKFSTYLRPRLDIYKTLKVSKHDTQETISKNYGRLSQQQPDNLDDLD